MTRDGWEALPKDVKTAFTEASAATQKHFCEYIVKSDTDVRQRLIKEFGFKVHRLTPEEAARWSERTATVVEDWKKQMNGQGLEGTQAVEAFTEAGKN